MYHTGASSTPLIELDEEDQREIEKNRLAEVDEEDDGADEDDEEVEDDPDEDLNF